MAILEEFQKLADKGAFRLGTYTPARFWHLEPGWEVAVRLNRVITPITGFIDNQADRPEERETVQYKKALGNGTSKGYEKMDNVILVSVKRHGKVVLDNRNALPPEPSGAGRTGTGGRRYGAQPLGNAARKRPDHSHIASGHLWPKQRKRVEEEKPETPEPDISFGNTALEAGQ